MTDSATRERIERIEAAAARSLELLEAGRTEEARERLSELLGAARDAVSVSGAALSDSELDAAFRAAEPELDEMVDADRVAQIALRQAGADELHVEGEDPDGHEGPERRGAAGIDLAPELPPSFATATMAELLERQGDVDGASRIRANLVASQGAAAGAPESAARPSRQRVLSTLERWLENVRGARA